MPDLIVSNIARLGDPNGGFDDVAISATKIYSTPRLSSTPAADLDRSGGS